MANIKDFYQTLGVARNAKSDQIRKQYRKLAAEFHPDVNRSPDAENRFKEIAQAYEVLGDEPKRKAYDEYGHKGLERGFKPEQGKSDFYGRWERSSRQRPHKANGLTRSGLNEESQLLYTILGLQESICDKVREKQFCDLEGDVEDIMGLHDENKDRFPRESGAENIVKSIPNYIYAAIFSGYKGNGYHGSGVALLEELLENRLSEKEMEALGQVCRVIGKDVSQMKEEVAVNATDLYILAALNRFTTDFESRDFKNAVWTFQRRKFVEKHRDHYGVVRNNLAGILETDPITVESAAVDRFFDLFVNPVRRRSSEEDLSRLSFVDPIDTPRIVAYNENSFLVTLACGLLDYHPAFSTAPVKSNGSNVQANHLAGVLQRHKDTIIGQMSKYRQSDVEIEAMYKLTMKMTRFAGRRNTKDVRQAVRAKKRKEIGWI